MKPKTISKILTFMKENKGALCLLIFIPIHLAIIGIHDLFKSSAWQWLVQEGVDFAQQFIAKSSIPALGMAVVASLIVVYFEQNQLRTDKKNYQRPTR